MTHVLLAWFAQRMLSEDEKRVRAARTEAVIADQVPSTWSRWDVEGPDWGVTMMHPTELGGYRWPPVDMDGTVTAVSLGIPVGISRPGRPAALAARLLEGHDVHHEAVPPFALLAVGRDHFVLQQDWLGMARVFTGSTDGVTAYSNRPSLLATFLSGATRPDLAAWTSYAASGSFHGRLSPIATTHLLGPGERVSGRRSDGRSWRLGLELRHSLDDIVRRGLADQGRRWPELLDQAVEALARVASTMRALYDDDITVGLSGGKDSRLIAAALLSAGIEPRFSTNEDTIAEGDVARMLVRLLREGRGLHLDHQVQRVGATESVLSTGLRERTVRLLRHYDHQFPSSYLARPAVSRSLPERVRPMTVTGAGGELVVGFWYPPLDSDVSTEQQARARMLVGHDALTPTTARTGDARIREVLHHARTLGMGDLPALDYLFLVERMQRWATSAYTTGMVTPMLVPDFVAASFAMNAEHKRERRMHTDLIARLIPEWSRVPFVSVSTGTSTATRVWDGDGIDVMADLLDSAHGPIAQLLDRPVVERSLRAAAAGGRPVSKILSQFTILAVASEELEPETRRAPIGVARARVRAPLEPPVAPTIVATRHTALSRSTPEQRSSRPARRLAWVRRTPIVARIWMAVSRRLHSR